MSDTNGQPTNGLTTTSRLAALSFLASLAPDTGGALMAGSFDPTDASNLNRVIEADLPADVDRLGMEGRVFEVEHWLARWEPNISPADQPAAPGVRVTLWSPGGERFTFAGKMAVRCWERVVSLLGPGPYAPPVKVTVMSFGLKNGRQSYGVVPIPTMKDATVVDIEAERVTFEGGPAKAKGGRK